MFAFGKHIIIVTGFFFNFFHSSFLWKKTWCLCRGFGLCGQAGGVVVRLAWCLEGETQWWAARQLGHIHRSLVARWTCSQSSQLTLLFHLEVCVYARWHLRQLVKTPAVRNRDLAHRVFLSASGLKSSPQVVVRSVERLGWPRWPPLPLKGCTLHMSSIASYVELINRYHQLIWKWATPKKGLIACNYFTWIWPLLLNPFYGKLSKHNWCIGLPYLFNPKR